MPLRVHVILGRCGTVCTLHSWYTGQYILVTCTVYPRDYTHSSGFIVLCVYCGYHDDVIKWKFFCVTGHLCGEFTGPRVNSPHKGQWRGALVFSLICVWINGWVNNRVAGDLRRYCAHYDVIVMIVTLPDRCWHCENHVIASVTTIMMIPGFHW